MSKENLFNAILPDSGFMCIVGIMYDKSKPAITRFFEIDNDYTNQNKTIASLAEQGYEVYYGCASYVEDTQRNVRNIHSLKSFYIDLDCGKGKDYPNKKEAFADVQRFCTETGMPMPTIVDSGRGVHGYWRLDNAIDYNTWKPVADALKEKLCELGVRIDRKVTGDGARILRIPETYNTKVKHDPRPVKVISISEELSLQKICGCIGYFPRNTTGSTTSDPVMDALLNSSRKWKFSKIYRKSIQTVDVMEEVPEEVTDAGGLKTIKLVRKKITRSQGCPQIAYSVANRQTLKEETWRAALSVAQCCVDRLEAIDMVSRGYGEPPTQPDEWIAKAEATNGAYSCAAWKEASEQPQLCSECIHRGKIKNPLALGVVIEEATPEDNIITDTHSTLGETVTMEIPNDYPFPWIRPRTGGVALRGKPDGAIQDDDEDVEEQLVYDNDLWVKKHIAADGHVLLQVALRLPHQGIIEFTAPMAQLLKTEKCQEILNSHGVAVVGKRLDLLRRYMAAWVALLQKRGAAEQARSQFGWCDDNRRFVIGNREIDENGDIHYSPITKSVEAVAAIYTRAGTLQDWQTVANTYGRPGNEARAFSLFCSFGAPLYKFIGEGSMLVHLTNVASGVGKSTAQRMATSVWGDPQRGLLSEHDTTNAKLHRAGVLNNIPVCIDEITNMVPEAVSRLAFELNSGRGKNRMKSHDNEERANHSTWATIFQTSGNNSLYDALDQYKTATEGEKYRIFEVPVPLDEELTKEQADELFGYILPRNYGIAGEEFMRYVVPNRENVLYELFEWRKKIDSYAGLRSKDRFFSACLACAFTGATIANHLGLIQIPVEPVLEWVIELVTGVKATIAEHSFVTEGKSFGPLVNKYWNSILPNVLVTHSGMSDVDEALVRKEADLKPVIGALKGRYDMKAERLYLAKDEFEKWMSGARAPTALVIKSLTKEGVLIEETSVNLGENTSKYSTAPVRVVVFDVTRLREH